MEATRGSTSSSSTHSSETHSILHNPFIVRHGRRYLKDLPYPLPCDLPELQRSNLQTLLATTVFGRPLCSPHMRKHPPKKVLEVACGSGYWSSLCHDYLSGLGHRNVSFTGLDIVPMAADLSKQGVNWRFVQHDLRKVPFPFSDGEFDLVMMKDLSLVVPLGGPQQKVLDECMRIVAKGGTIELWEADSVIRSILPHPPAPPGKNAEDDDIAAATATFLISPGTPFTDCQNKYLQDSNAWIQDAIDKRKLYPMPCARILQVLLQEPDTLYDVDYRRIAIPLGEMRWERELDGGGRILKRRDSELKGKGKSDSYLTEDQAALRHTALTVVIQLIESLEPLLKEVSGKNQEEWQRWWGWMMDDLLTQKGASSGECLEVGAWWTRKV
ncbi:uncharacterized protein K452DRAFT_284720 [Aplosporella prunicola CBS 121167]|uniref:Methyltransferase domain-containing protein n=1 Tax=Aplosporella prunicola CBS 121167 TaxID=1176127 RepID=A0A6A6BL61_9PEZI|nr:uncharacterized protein K452DRAFT_284720 [Aplosporella prunicola CBS 121167]KAF2144408.1 hypothetical protein K452DRAFT_284720 [Aplosporella prunicola CBS 121167]